MNKKLRVATEEDFIIAPRYNNSLAALLRDYPDGVPPQIICRVLGITLLEYESLLQSGIMKVRDALGVNPDDQ